LDSHGDRWEQELWRYVRNGFPASCGIPGGLPIQKGKDLGPFFEVQYRDILLHNAVFGHATPPEKMKGHVSGIR